MSFLAIVVDAEPDVEGFRFWPRRVRAQRIQHLNGAVARDVENYDGSRSHIGNIDFNVLSAMMLTIIRSNTHHLRRPGRKLFEGANSCSPIDDRRQIDRIDVIGDDVAPGDDVM